MINFRASFQNLLSVLLFCSFCSFANASDLTKRGEGLYRFLFWDVSTAELFLPAGKSSQSLLESTTPRRLEITYLLEIEAKDFVKSANKYLAKNFSSEELATFAKQTATLNSWYQDVKEGDQYILEFLPEKGTTLYYNERPLGTLPGAGFANHYFSIWLGDKPVDKKVKNQLLGLD